MSKSLSKLDERFCIDAAIAGGSLELGPVADGPFHQDLEY